MRALVYDPYVDTMGGGERYAFTFALALLSLGYSVDLAWRDEMVVKEAHRRFNLDLAGVRINPPAYRDLSLSAGLLARYGRTKNYDLVFWVSDGSLPYLFGRKNYLHFQVPFKKIGGSPLNNFLKSTRVSKLIFNSRFTANVIKKQLPFVPSTVLYPPVDTTGFQPGKKDKVILSVARFDSPSHAKRQDVLIDAFKKLHQQGKDYQLILVGAVKGEGGDAYLASLKDLAGELPIKFVANPSFDELKKLYAKTKIFWHAAGYEVDEEVEPEKVEHFGIATVEAMAAGAVPVVIDKGGQREIITPNSGFLCLSLAEIIEKTNSLIDNPKLLTAYSRTATARAGKFDQVEFVDQARKIIS